jgi:hypothetical protein
VPGLMQLGHDADDLARLAQARAGKLLHHESPKVSPSEAPPFSGQATDETAPSAHSTGHGNDSNDAPVAAVEPGQQPKVFDMRQHANTGAAPATVAPEPELDLSILKKRTVKSEDELSHGDTIYIDKEGNLKVITEEKKAEKEVSKEAARKDGS